MERENVNDESIGTLDFETDPFKAGRIPEPFAVCFYFSDKDYFMLWDNDSKTPFIPRVVSALRRLPACTLYAHNGGRFDFHYLLEYADRNGPFEVRNGRVVRCRFGKAILKDSFPLMPFALAEFRKTKIDYAIFEKRRRYAPHNRTKITSYLLDDCRDLRELVIGFRAVVGDKDTIGGASFYQMRKLGIKIKSLSETHDAMFRPYYYGGRVQAFEKGVFNGPFSYYDINSAYPFAMLANHPHGSDYRRLDHLPSRVELPNCFVHIRAASKGALPFRSIEGALSFPVTDDAEFFATGHEILAGIETNTIRVHRVIDCWMPQNFISFKEYVNTFFALRQRAKREGDEIRRLAYKYLLNSGYGKFAQNPRDFKQYKLAPIGEYVHGYTWEADYGSISIWCKPSYQGFGFYDVATGASITGYVRAMLWRAIVNSRRVLYVDTDSIICKSSSIPKSNNLGDWKLEGCVKRVAIGGKKLYGVEWAGRQKDKMHKIASKGARLTWKEILQICAGNEIIWRNDAPTFSLAGAHFVERKIKGT